MLVLVLDDVGIGCLLGTAVGAVEAVGEGVVAAATGTGCLLMIGVEVEVL